MAQKNEFIGGCIRKGALAGKALQTSWTQQMLNPKRKQQGETMGGLSSHQKFCKLNP